MKVRVEVRIRVKVRIGVRVEVRIRVRVKVRIRVRVKVRIGVRVKVRIGVRVKVRIRVRVKVRIRVRLNVRIRVRVKVRIRVRVKVRIWVRVKVRIWVRLNVRIRFTNTVRDRFSRGRSTWAGAPASSSVRTDAPALPESISAAIQSKKTKLRKTDNEVPRREEQVKTSDLVRVRARRCASASSRGCAEGESGHVRHQDNVRGVEPKGTATRKTDCKAWKRRGCE
eukprot:6133719-Pleurochrysis_carterae.AAC.1